MSLQKDAIRCGCIGGLSLKKIDLTEELVRLDSSPSLIKKSGSFHELATRGESIGPKLDEVGTYCLNDEACLIDISKEFFHKEDSNC